MTPKDERRRTAAKKQRRTIDEEFGTWDQFRDEFEFGGPVRSLTDYSRMELRAYQPRLTALVDILGFSELVRRVGCGDVADANALAALRVLAQFREGASEDLDFIVDKRVACFSDHVVISYPFYEFANLTQLIIDVIVLTQRMVDRDITVRGSIVLAPLYQTSGIIFGQALVDAHMLEAKRARNPRVIVAPNVVRWAVGLGAHSSDKALSACIEEGTANIAAEGFDNFEFLNWLRKDEEDGYYFVDHLRAGDARLPSDAESVREHRAYLRKVRALIIGQRKRLTTAKRTSKRIEERRAKWRWYANYFNQAARKAGSMRRLDVESVVP